MIKTTELMLGNIIEYKNAYVQVINLAYGDLMIRHNGVRVAVVESDINPIPLTESVLKRLGIESIGFESIHQLQNHRTNNQRKPIDITPLLAPRYTTHDGVEVWEGDLVYYTIINSNINPQQIIVSKSNMDKIGYIFFSTLDACLSYNYSVTRKPIFTTEDGVDVFEGDEYYATSISGYDKYGYEAIVDKIKVPKVWEGDDTKVRFANKETAKKYLQWVLTKSQAEKAEAEYQSLLNTKK